MLEFSNLLLVSEYLGVENRHVIVDISLSLHVVLVCQCNSDMFSPMLFTMRVASDLFEVSLTLQNYKCAY